MASKDTTLSAFHRKRALVIGNQNYPKLPLKNPIKDATDLRKSLIDCGFEVTSGTDCKQEAMIKLKNSFIANTNQQDFILFYYSGHGAQFENNNYLIPIDREIELESDEFDPNDYFIEVQSILRNLSRKNSYLIFFILDCCRTNLFDRRSKGPNVPGAGLRSIETIGSSMVFYACAPGTVADDGNSSSVNGLFTKHLLIQLKTPNKSLDDIVRGVTYGVNVDSNARQRPSVLSSVVLQEPIYLNIQTESKPETTRTQVPIQPRKVAEKPNAPPKPPAEFDEEGKFEEVFCEGRRCAKCGRCRDWYFTGDSKTWKWVQGWKNWKDDDWKRYWDNDVHELWKKRTDGATCLDRRHRRLLRDLRLRCVCEDNHR